MGMKPTSFGVGVGESPHRLLPIHCVLSLPHAGARQPRQPPAAIGIFPLPVVPPQRERQRHLSGSYQQGTAQPPAALSLPSSLPRGGARKDTLTGSSEIPDQAPFEIQCQTPASRKPPCQRAPVMPQGEPGSGPSAGLLSRGWDLLPCDRLKRALPGQRLGWSLPTRLKKWW